MFCYHLGFILLTLFTIVQRCMTYGLLVEQNKKIIVICFIIEVDHVNSYFLLSWFKWLAGDPTKRLQFQAYISGRFYSRTFHILAANVTLIILIFTVFILKCHSSSAVLFWIHDAHADSWDAREKRVSSLENGCWRSLKD